MGAVVRTGSKKQPVFELVLTANRSPSDKVAGHDAARIRVHM